MNRKLVKVLLIALVSILGLFALLYLGGIAGQVLENYQEWLEAGGMTGQAQISRVSWKLGDCLSHAFTGPGLAGMLVLLTAIGAIFGYVKLHDKFDGKTHDERGFTVTKNGLYGTASWMSEKEMKKVLEVSTPEQAEGTILGESHGKVICMPKDTRLNRHIAVFGASGTMKTRAVVRNALFQTIKRGESVVVTDTKGELYGDTAELYRQNGYDVKVFNLVSPTHGDSWNCMSDLQGDTLMAHVLTNVIIGNTSSGKGDHFWDNGEANLLKASCRWTIRLGRPSTCSPSPATRCDPASCWDWARDCRCCRIRRCKESQVSLT